MLELTDKNVLITGASSGIGKQTAYQLSSLGAHCFISARNEERLKLSYEALKVAGEQKHHMHCADLVIPEDIQTLIDELPALDGVVCNAGLVKTKPLKYIDEKLIDDMFDVNTKAVMLLISGLLKAKKLKKGASISIVSSISTYKHTPANSVYSASKSALNAFTTSSALELAKKKIRVNAVLPGFIQTNLMQDDKVDNNQLEKHLKNYPLGRFGTPEDVANILCFLMSDKSEWMTGNLIKIDGGFSIH
jgi:NAD(P)-dependent dehydrogenase (short-subunit alcohol dehydrogenase family)